MNNRFPYPGNMNTRWVPWDTGTGFPPLTDPNRCPLNPQQEQFQGRINFNTMGRTMQPSWVYKDMSVNYGENNNRTIGMMSVNQLNMMSQNNQHMMSRNQQMLAQNQQLIGQNYQQMLNQNHQMIFPNSQQMMSHNNQQMMLNQCNRMPGPVQNNFSNSQMLNNSFTQGIQPLMSLMLPRGPIQLHNFNQSNENEPNFENADQGYAPNSSGKPPRCDMGRKQAKRRYRSKSKWRNTEPERNDSNSSKASYSEELKVESVVTHKRQVTRSRSCGSGLKDWRNTGEETVTVQTKETIVTRTPVHTVFEYNHHKPSRGFPTSYDDGCRYASETDELTNPEIEHDLDSSERSSHSLGNDNDILPLVEEQDVNSKETSYISQDRKSLDGAMTLRTDKNSFPSGSSDLEVLDDYIHKPVYEAKERSLYGNEDHQTTEVNKAKAVGIIDGKYVFDQGEYDEKRSQQAEERTIVKQRNEKEMNRSLQLRDEAWNNILKSTFEDSSTESASETVMSDSCTKVRSSLLKSILKKPIPTRCEDRNEKRDIISHQTRDKAWKNSLKSNLNKGFEDSSTESASETLMSDSCTNDIEERNSLLKSILRKPMSPSYEQRHENKSKRSHCLGDQSWKNDLNRNVKKSFQDSSTESGSATPLSESSTHDYKVKKKWSRSFLKKSTSTHCEEDKYSAAPTSDETNGLSPHWLRSSYSKPAMKKFNTETRKRERKRNRKVRQSENFDIDSFTDENNIPKTTGSNSVYRTLLEMDQRCSSAKYGRQIMDKSYGTVSSSNTPVSKQVKGFSDTDKCKDKQSFHNITGRVKGSMNPEDESCIPGMEHYVFSPPSNPPSRPSSPCLSGTGTSGETLKTFSQNIQSSKPSSGSERKKNNQSIGNPSLSPKEPPKFWSTDYLNFVRKANSTDSTTQKQKEGINSCSASVKPTSKWSKAERSSKLRTVLPENTNPPSERGMSKMHLSNKENLRSIAAIRPVNAAPKVTAVTDNTMTKLSSVSFSNQTWNSSPRSKRLLSPSSFYGHKTDTSTRPHIRDNNLSTKITSTSSVGSSIKHNNLSDKVVTCKKTSKSHAVLGDKKLTITLIRGKKYSSEHRSKDNCRSIMSPVSRRTNVRTCILAGRKSSSQTASAQKPRSSGYHGRKTRSLDSSPYDAKLMKDVRVRVEDLNLSKLTQARVPRICLGDRFAAQQMRMESESSSTFKAKESDEKNKETSEIHKDYSQGEEDCLKGQHESLNVSTQHEDEGSGLEEDDLANSPVLKTQEIEVTVKRKRGRPPGSKTGKRKKKTARTRESLNSRFSSSEFKSPNKHEKKYGRPLGSKNKSIVHSTSLLTRRTSRSLRSSDKSSKQTVEMTVHEKIHSFTITKEDSHDHKMSVPPKSNFHKPKVTPIKITVPKPKETESKKNVTPLKISIVGLRNSKKDDFVVPNKNVPTLKMILLRKGLVTDIVLDHSDEDKQVVTPLKISGSSVTKKKIEPLKLSLKPQERMDTSSENVGNVDSQTKSETETASSKLKDCESKDTNSETVVREEEVASQHTHLRTKPFSESKDMDSQEEMSESIQPCENKEDLSTDTSDETVAILDRESHCGPSEIPNKAEESVLTMSEPEDQDQIETDAENADTNGKDDTEMEDSALPKQLNNIPSPSLEGEPGELTDNQDTSSGLRDEEGKHSTHSAKGFKSDDSHNQVSSPVEPESFHSRKQKSTSRSTNDTIGNIDDEEDEMKDTVSKKSKFSDEEEDVSETGKTESTLDLKGYSPDNAVHTIEFESDSGLDTSFNRSEDSVERNIFDALISAAEKDDDLVQKIRKQHLRSRSDSNVANNSIQESRRSPRKRRSSEEVENFRLQKKISKEKKREMSSKERQRYQNFQTNLRLLTKNMNPCLTKRKMVENSEKNRKQRTSESSGSEVSGIWEKTSRNKNVTDKELLSKGKTASQTSKNEDVRILSKKQKRTHECSESSDTSPRKRTSSEYENCKRQRNSSKGNNSQSTLQQGDNSNSPTTKQARNTSHKIDFKTFSSRKSSTSSLCKQATSTSQRRDLLDSSKGNNSDSDVGQRRSRITFNMIKGDKLPGTNLRRRLCLYCRTFSTRLDHIMKEHVKLLHPHKCVLCKMAFKDEVETKAHRLTRHLHEVHHCLLCRKVFTSPFHYKKHVRSRAHLQLQQVQKDTLDAICRVFSQDQGDDSFSATLKKIQDQEAQLWNVRQGGKGRKALPAPGDQQPSCVQAPNLSHLKHFYYDNPELESVVRQIKDFVNSQKFGLTTRQQQQLQDQDEHFFFALPNVEDTESWTVTSESETEFSTRVTSVGNPDILDRSLSEVLGMVLSENSAQAQSSCLSDASYASVSSNRSLSSTEPLIIDTGTESSVFSDVDGHSGQFMSLLSDGALSFEDDSSEFLESPGQDLQEFLVPLQVPVISMKSAGRVPGNAFESVLPKPLTLPSLEPADDEDNHPLVLNCTQLEDNVPKDDLVNVLKPDSSEIDPLALAKSFFTSKSQDECLDVGSYPTAVFETKQPQLQVCSRDRDDTSQTVTGKDKRISLTSLRGCTHIETTEVVSVEDLIQCQTGNMAVVEVDGGQAQEVAAETDQEGVSGIGEVDTECGPLKANDGACKNVREEIGETILNTTSVVNKSEILNTNDEANDNEKWQIGDKTELKDLESDNKIQNEKPIMASTVDVDQGQEMKAKTESDQVCASNEVLDAKTKGGEIMMDIQEYDHVNFTKIEEKHMECLKYHNKETTFDNTVSEESEIVSDSGFKITNDEHENIKEEATMDISVLEEQGTNTEANQVDPTSCLDDKMETFCVAEASESIHEKGEDVEKTSVVNAVEEPSHQLVVENTKEQQVRTVIQQPSCETVYGSINRPQVDKVELGTSSISSDESDKFCESAQKGFFENDPFCSGRKNRQETRLEMSDTQVVPEVHQNTQNGNMVDAKTSFIPKENSNMLAEPEFIEQEVKIKDVAPIEISDDSTEKRLIEKTFAEKDVTEMVENKIQVNMSGSSTLTGNNSQETSSEDPETASGLIALVSGSSTLSGNNSQETSSEDPETASGLMAPVSVSRNLCENGQTEKLCEKEEIESYHDLETASGLMAPVSVSRNLCENGQTENFCENECCDEEMKDGNGAEKETGIYEEKYQTGQKEVLCDNEEVKCCEQNKKDGNGADLETGIYEEKYQTGQKEELCDNEEVKCCEQKKKDENGTDVETDVSAEKKLEKEHGITELSEDSASFTIEGTSCETQPVKEVNKESDFLTSEIVRTSFPVKDMYKETDNGSSTIEETSFESEPDTHCSLSSKDGTRFESVAIKDIYKETDSASSTIEETSFEDESFKGINKETVFEPSGTPQTFEGEPLNVYGVKDVVLCQPNLSDSESQEVFPDTGMVEKQLKDEVKVMLRELVDHVSSSTGDKPS